MARVAQRSADHSRERERADEADGRSEEEHLEDGREGSGEERKVVPGVGIPLGLRDEEAMQEGGDGGTGEGVWREGFSAEGPWEDDLKVVAMDAPTEGGDGEGGAGGEGDGGGCEGSPGFFAEEVKEEDGGEDLGHGRDGDQRAGEGGKSALPGKAGCYEEGEEKDIELAEEEIAMEREAEDGEEGDAVDGLGGEGLQGKCDGDEEGELQEEPEVLGLEWGERGKGIEEEGGEGSDGGEADDGLIELAMIFLTLEPAPFICLGGVEALVSEPGGEEVVGEVRVEGAPGARHGVGEERGGEDEEQRPLEGCLQAPGDDGVHCFAPAFLAGVGWMMGRG
jgi:hypothetical protein